jgi:hypothetical protein
MKGFLCVGSFSFSACRRSHITAQDSGGHRIFFGEVQQIQLRTEGRENGDLGGGSPLVRGSTQFANDWNPYSDKVVTDVFSTELGVRLILSSMSPWGFETATGCLRPRGVFTYKNVNDLAPRPLDYHQSCLVCHLRIMTGPTETPAAHSGLTHAAQCSK